MVAAFDKVSEAIGYSIFTSSYIYFSMLVDFFTKH
jgi:hypothetical protein